MTSCPQCQAAEATPSSAEFAPGCRSCEARALAVTRADLLPREQYRDAVRQVFGDGAQAGHAMVKAWIAKIRRDAAAQGTAR